ncbi:hypothetical protein BurJ1DRAFT_1837 [Burkholderiales bacterium JOSHI_001]|nr:hypothetical protein BurJ1DRAFT_1837 [Burkholderiales bacterium JOSHI_001]
MGPFRDGWTSDDLDRVLANGDPVEVLYVPIVVGMNAPDCGPEWAQTICQRLTLHPSGQVRANAMLGLSHIARTTRRLNLDLALPAVQRALNDPELQVRQTAREVVADIRVFMNGEFASHPLAYSLSTADAGDA